MGGIFIALLIVFYKKVGENGMKWLKMSYFFISLLINKAFKGKKWLFSQVNTHVNWMRRADLSYHLV